MLTDAAGRCFWPVLNLQSRASACSPIFALTAPIRKPSSLQPDGRPWRYRWGTDGECSQEYRGQAPDVSADQLSRRLAWDVHPDFLEPGASPKLYRLLVLSLPNRAHSTEPAPIRGQRE